MCAEGRDMYGHKPGSAEFRGEFGTFKEAEAALTMIGQYFRALAARN